MVYTPYPSAKRLKTRPFISSKLEQSKAEFNIINMGSVDNRLQNSALETGE